ncbi:hypothetical protein PIB30_080155 [Stylosanthes scabra]|uniref:Uncharacterized protein n=1 Tax=Stylosanthes scabra TaxID=79078 RepID=A0ABU6YU13_9FABA|nr:hypothetical protein [Stylosanthes scabra]
MVYLPFTLSRSIVDRRRPLPSLSTLSLTLSLPPSFSATISLYVMEPVCSHQRGSSAGYIPSSAQFSLSPLFPRFLLPHFLESPKSETLTSIYPPFVVSSSKPPTTSPPPPFGDVSESPPRLTPPPSSSTFHCCFDFIAAETNERPYSPSARCCLPSRRR